MAGGRRPSAQHSRPTDAGVLVVMGYLLVGVLLALLVLLGSSVRVVTQYQRGIVFRLGKAQQEIRQPGVAMLMPLVDRLHKVNMQIVTMPVPAQE